MPKFDIAAVISAVRSPLQFAALLAILIFLAFLVLRLGPEQRPRLTCGAGLICPAQENRQSPRDWFTSHWNTADGCIKLRLGDWSGRRTQPASGRQPTFNTQPA